MPATSTDLEQTLGTESSVQRHCSIVCQGKSSACHTDNIVCSALQGSENLDYIVLLNSWCLTELLVSDYSTIIIVKQEDHEAYRANFCSDTALFSSFVLVFLCHSQASAHEVFHSVTVLSGKMERY